MQLSGAQAMVQALEQAGVTTILDIARGSHCSFYDALVDSTIRHVLTRNEQGQPTPPAAMPGPGKSRGFVWSPPVPEQPMPSLALPRLTWIRSPW